MIYRDLNIFRASPSRNLERVNCLGKYLWSSIRTHIYASTPFIDLSHTMTAKRTHSRRSCELCKRRKSRCELPDQWVASSTEPQPMDKSCHRCIVLSVPCIVDDTGRRRGLPDRPQRQSRAKPRAEPEKEAVGNAPSSSTPGFSLLSDQHVYGRARVLHDFRPQLNGVTPPDVSMSNSMHQIKTMELHGRPLRLACVMLGAAYANKENSTQRLLRLCPPEMVTRLGPG